MTHYYTTMHLHEKVHADHRAPSFCGRWREKPTTLWDIVGKVRSLPLKVRSGSLNAWWAWHICQFQRIGKRYWLFPRIKSWASWNRTYCCKNNFARANPAYRTVIPQGRSLTMTILLTMYTEQVIDSYSWMIEFVGKTFHFSGLVNYWNTHKSYYKQWCSCSITLLTLTRISLHHCLVVCLPLLLWRLLAISVFSFEFTGHYSFYNVSCKIG